MQGVPGRGGEGRVRGNCRREGGTVATTSSLFHFQAGSSPCLSKGLDNALQIHALSAPATSRVQAPAGLKGLEMLQVSKVSGLSYVSRIEMCKLR